MGKVPELDTGVREEALYLIQPADLDYDLYTADSSGLHGTSGTTGMQTAGKLSDVVERTGTQFVTFSSRLSGIQVSFPGQPLPNQVSRGKLHYRLVRVPKNVPPDKVARIGSAPQVQREPHAARPGACGRKSRRLGYSRRAEGGPAPRRRGRGRGPTLVSTVSASVCEPEGPGSRGVRAACARVAS